MKTQTIVENLEQLRGWLKRNGFPGARPAIQALTEAIKLLKKPEIVIPHRNYQYLSDYWCECGWHLGKKGDVKFCSQCGRRIEWEEKDDDGQSDG